MDEGKIRDITMAKTGHRFKPGQSGNPAGRPKKTQEERDALEGIKRLAPDAVDKLRTMLSSSKVSASVKVKICEIILDRTYGKAENAVKVTSVKESIENSREYINSLVDQIGKEG